MISRRWILKSSALAMLTPKVVSANTGAKSNNSNPNPIIISTWNHGVVANQTAWQVLQNGTALDAVEAGVRTSEADPNVGSVGYGGLPDRDGNVTLDACIMDHNSNCGSVAFVQNFKHPVSIARGVMEKTRHVMLVGKGAEQFALEQGFKKENLLTKKSEKRWKKWLENQDYRPKINSENHDTISQLILDQEGQFAGACTTSGAAWKMHGRVGDSPIIGAGLFIDGEVGAVACTGLGEAVIKTSASSVATELMRQGHSPEDACREVTERIVRLYKNHPDLPHLQVAFIAINTKGETGAYAFRSGFNYALNQGSSKTKLIDSNFIEPWS